MDMMIFFIYFILWIIANTIESLRKISVIIGLLSFMGILLKYLIFVPILYNTGDINLCINLITSLILDFVQWVLPPWVGFLINSAFHLD
ncbi:hypothetical protein [Methanocaldococcus infernus]